MGAVIGREEDTVECQAHCGAPFAAADRSYRSGTCTHTH